MALPENFVSREDLGWGPTGADYADPDLGLVIHYDSSVLGLANKPHTECIAYWNNTRSFHMNGRGWADVGYSFFCCPHDYILEGRGLNRYQAAQGTTAGNSNYYSATLATGPGEPIPAAQINAVRRLRWWLIQDHGNHSQVLGHRDFTSTSCPGELAYDMVEDGTFAQPPGAVLNTMGMEHMLGLKKGDEGEPVQDLQAFLNDAGHRPANSFFDGSWDGIYGDGVSDAVLAARQSMGSSATNGDRISYWAANQLRRAWFKKQFEKAMADADLPESTSTSMPTEFDATIKVK